MLAPTAAKSPGVSSAASAPTPKSIPKVVTTFSLAISPVTAATAIFQSPQPRGANNGAITPPIAARILLSSCSSSSIANFPSIQPNPCKNQRTIAESSIIVPAFLINDQPLSHMLLKILDTVGIW